MRVGILGAGAMGAVHAAAWARVPDVEIAGIAGRTSGRATALAARFGARPFTDVTTLLDDETIDAVDITTPTASHRELVLAALARGKHVLCETPLASELADVDAMIAAARRSDALLQVALLSRVAQPGTQVREWLRAGLFGRPLVLSFERLWPGLAQLDDPEDHHGDALEEVSLFDIDYLVWCFGLPRSVTASAARAGLQAVAHVTTMLDLGDVCAVVEGSVALPSSFAFRIGARAVCEDGTIEWLVRFAANGPPVVELVRYPRRGEPERVQALEENPYEAECARFAGVVRGVAEPDLLGAEAARDGLRVVAAARESLRSGGPVAIG